MLGMELVQELELVAGRQVANVGLGRNVLKPNPGLEAQVERMERVHNATRVGGSRVALHQRRQGTRVVDPMDPLALAE